MIIAPELSTNLFMWHKHKRTFTAEASTLRDQHLSRFFDDACDVGFIMQSERTGRRMGFILSGEQKRDGDIIAWEFIAYELRGRHGIQFPVGNRTSLRCIVFND